MRLLWTFFAGLIFTALALAVSAPVVGGVGVALWLARGPLWTTLSGHSYFAIRDEDGRLAGKTVNVGFHLLPLPASGDTPARRLLLRLEVASSEFAAPNGDERVRLDAWPLEGAPDLKRRPLYTLTVPGRAATIDPDGTLTVERGGRHSAYALGNAAWLYDSDVPVATFTGAGERKRVVALAVADDDLGAGATGVLAYASAERAIRRLVIAAADPMRGRALRTAVALTRPVTRIDDGSERVLEVPLPAGTLRIPFVGDDLAIERAEIPDGLSLAEIRPWGITPAVSR